jgi:ABC-type amino acid transport substrate-binding protein
VLVAGGPEALVLAARRVAKLESASIVVEACGAITVASVAASVRPFAFVLNQDLYAFDPEEFAALARDVQADLVVVKATGAAAAFLEQALRPSLRTAFRRYRMEKESGTVSSTTPTEG